MAVPALSRRTAWLLAALLLASCGGGGRGEVPTTAGTQAAAAAPDRESAQLASQLAAAGPDEALAVAAALASRLHWWEANRIRQMIVFGDSLSDVGTYKVGAIEQVGGGKFTTNPGPVWPETIGVLLDARVTPFRLGFGGVSQIVGGTGFAMGGARVSQQPGIGCNPDSQTLTCTAALTIPVSQQISDYLAANGDRFTRNQLVTVWAGGSDVLIQVAAFLAAVQAGAPSDTAAADALLAVQLAAGELAQQVQRTFDHGATRVAVFTLPDLANSVSGQTAPPSLREFMSGLVLAFNATLQAGLDGTAAKVIDTHALFDRVVENPLRYHVSVLNAKACDAAKIAVITGGQVQDGSSLFCSLVTLVQSDAELHYFFADDVHPTTLGHLIVAGFVLTELWRQRLL